MLLAENYDLTVEKPTSELLPKLQLKHCPMCNMDTGQLDIYSMSDHILRFQHSVSSTLYSMYWNKLCVPHFLWWPPPTWIQFKTFHFYAAGSQTWPMAWKCHALPAMNAASKLEFEQHLPYVMLPYRGWGGGGLCRGPCPPKYPKFIGANLLVKTFALWTWHSLCRSPFNSIPSNLVEHRLESIPGSVWLQ